VEALNMTDPRYFAKQLIEEADQEDFEREKLAAIEDELRELSTLYKAILAELKRGADRGIWQAPVAVSGSGFSVTVIERDSNERIQTVRIQRDN